MRQFDEKAYKICSEETVDALRNAGLEVWTTEGSTRPGTVCSPYRVFCMTEDGYTFRLDSEIATSVDGDYYTWTDLAGDITMTTEDLIGEDS